MKKPALVTASNADLAFYDLRSLGAAWADLRGRSRELFSIRDQIPIVFEPLAQRLGNDVALREGVEALNFAVHRSFQ